MNNVFCIFFAPVLNRTVRCVETRLKHVGLDNISFLPSRIRFFKCPVETLDALTLQCVEC
jgi:hypothetical protein